MMPYRLQRIDFLPYMFAYEFVIMTRKPLQVPEYEALTYPFDNYIWIFLFSSMAVVSCTLIMLQTIWSTGPGEDSPKDSSTQSEYLLSIFSLAEFATYIPAASTILLPAMLLVQSVPDDWVFKRNFSSRNLLLLSWLLWGGILIMGYKSTLLSTLIKIRYEDVIEDIYDMDQSQLPFLLPDATAASLFGADKRTVMRRVYSRRILFPFRGFQPQWTFDM